MANFQDFYNYAYGKVFDTNGNVSSSTVVQWSGLLAGQCVSLIKGYLKWGGAGVKAYGNAIQYWTCRNTNGILNVCDVVTGAPRNGDIGVSAGGDARYGHVFIYYNGQAMAQNVNNNPRALLYPISWQGAVYGYLRPKFLTTSVSYNANQLVNEHAIATLTQNINKRKDTPNGAVVTTLSAGTKVEYTQKWVGNGHRYVSWLEGSARYFVAVSGSETQGQDPWATFSAIEANTEPSKPSGTITLTEEHAVAMLTVDGVRARLNSPRGDVVRTYNAGDKIEYTHKYVGNGHRYIVWTEGNNKIFLAISGTEDRTDMWATFSSVEDKEVAQPPKQETVKTYEDTLDEAEQIDLAPEVLEDCEGLNLTVSLVDKTHYKARCPYVMKPEYVVIHNAATPNGTAKSLCVCQNKTVNSEAELKSWHFSVDEDSVWESLPLNRNGFHASDGANGDGNRKGIAIEIARDLDGEEQYYQSAENRGALLAAVLLNKYGWDTSHLKTHHDFAIDGKWCPHKILDNGWDKFVAKVQSYLDEIQGKNIEKEQVEPAEPEIPKEEVKQDEEQVDVKQVNSLVSLLIKLVEKLLGIFK